jgi:hypothetical protein
MSAKDLQKPRPTLIFVTRRSCLERSPHWVRASCLRTHLGDSSASLRLFEQCCLYFPNFRPCWSCPLLVCNALLILPFVLSALAGSGRGRVENMSSDAAQGQHVGELPDVPPKLSPAAQEHNRKKIISFKVTHILLTLFVLWLT